MERKENEGRKERMGKEKTEERKDILKKIAGLNRETETEV